LQIRSLRSYLRILHECDCCAGPEYHHASGHRTMNHHAKGLS
jgi:hypothetical protein